MDGQAHILAYADDVVIFTNGSRLSDIHDNLQNNLITLAGNLRFIDLNISTEKSKWCIFHETHRFHTIQKHINLSGSFLKLQDEIIPLSPNATFLGFSFDTNLNWKLQINKTKLTCMKRINLFKSFSGIRWGAHPTTLLMIYKGLIRSVLDWGGIVLTDLHAKYLIPLNRIQYKCARIILGLMSTTLTNVLLDQISEWPLWHRWRFLEKKFALKVL